MHTPSIDQKITCLAREVAMRKSAYPRWVTGGKMSQATATAEIETMDSILGDYIRQRDAAQPTLFPE